MKIEIEEIFDTQVLSLLEEHLLEMQAECPEETMHALDVEGLQKPEVDLWVAREGNTVLACCALKRLSASHGELKSLRAANAAKSKGVGSRLLKHILVQARIQGYEKLSLETGASPYFAAAVTLFRRVGFSSCGPFADYQEHPTSLFFEIDLQGMDNLL